MWKQKQFHIHLKIKFQLVVIRDISERKEADKRKRIEGGYGAIDRIKNEVYGKYIS